MQITVGGCLAQKDQARIVERAPYVDVVFGTHNVGSLPVLFERARVEQASQVELLEVFPSALPARRASTASAWVSISVGCDNTCTFCIVPSLRGKEDRRPGDVLREVEVLAQQGRPRGHAPGAERQLVRPLVRRPRRLRQAAPGGRRCPGSNASASPARTRRDFTDDVVTAMAETPTVCPSLHMPLQSGYDDVLRAMRRSYRSERFLAILSRVRDQIPDAAITTDIIVGFPTETEADFAETLRVVEAARFSGAFTFQYSPRPGTPAAGLPPFPREVVQERYERLVARRHLALGAGRRRRAPPSHPALIPPPRTSPPRASPASAHACAPVADPYAGLCSRLPAAVGDRRSDLRRYDTDGRRSDEHRAARKLALSVQRKPGDCPARTTIPPRDLQR
jgi:tRNA-2-methylthio-N6-dimethylallyladenosine synthase